jgi:outer membrane immunogenic protein
MLRRVLCAVGVSSLLIAAPLSVAGAADMSMPLKAPLAAPPSYYAWTGCYLDAGGGYGLWNQDHSASGPGFATATTTDGGRGWLGRFGAGCDYQLGGNFSRWVVGIFGDYDVMDLKGTNSTSLVDPVSGSPLTTNEKESGAWYVGGRIGYLITPSVFTYASAGYTETRFDAQTEFLTSSGAPNGFGFPAQTYQGWFLGGGTETSLGDFLPGLPRGLFLRSEYRFSTYDSRNLAEIATATGIADGNIENTRPYVQTITTSLVWRFNWLGR